MSSTSFAEAVAESKKLPQKPDNETLLRLYALYKQATEGNAPTETAFGMFDFVAKAKHEAWLRLQDLSKKEAETRYIELVQNLSGN
jgi:acyl-CoA-binding protein